MYFSLLDVLQYVGESVMTEEKSGTHYMRRCMDPRVGVDKMIHIHLLINSDCLFDLRH